MAYSPEEKKNIIDKVCAIIRRGKSVRDIYREDKEKKELASEDTFYEWIKEKEFSEQYARACEIRSFIMFDEIIDIADNSQDEYVDENGNKRIDHSAVQKKRLMIDARKWALSKMLPKKYGDKLDLTTDGESMNMTPEERQKRIQELLAKANVKRD